MFNKVNKPHFNMFTYNKFFIKLKKIFRSAATIVLELFNKNQLELISYLSHTKKKTINENSTKPNLYT